MRSECSGELHYTNNLTLVSDLRNLKRESKSWEKRVNVNKMKMTMTIQLGKTSSFLLHFLEKVWTVIPSSASFTKAE